MKELTDSPMCELASGLISFVYDELSPAEMQAFKVHLNTCQTCAADLDSFGDMRTAISQWRYESLTGMSPAQEAAVPVNARRKSAVAALREFFDLSPLWLKGLSFAGLLLCALAVVAIIRLQQPVSVVQNKQPDKTYSEAQVKELIAKALAEQEAKNTTTIQNSKASEEIVPEKKLRRSDSPPEVARSRRPLSRAEREQLAADLRLSNSREEGVILISDRINEE
ncbi:MAG: hypothetical protein C5B55_03175 [Blastocatellia bacterium]|nr:MAG: hypothetical protein C5B55_03175 [Blastocatellia bacterium]